MAKRKSFEVSPGKGGIGHKIRKAKKPKNPLKSLKAFGTRKITDFLSENPHILKPVKRELEKPERRVLGEVGNLLEKGDSVADISKSNPGKDMENSDAKTGENDSEIVQEINEIYEKYKSQTNLVENLVKMNSEVDVKKEEAEEEKEGDLELKAEEPEYDPEMEGLCEYEKIRLRNIRERQQMFAQLQIQEAKTLCSPASASKPNKPQKRVLKPKENIEPRKSRRIAGGVPEINRYSASFEDHPLDKDLVSRPRRSLPVNYNDYLQATRTFSGDERPDGLVPVEEGRFKILQVPKKCTIKQFVLSNNLEFKCGRGFYEFTKPEIISHRKEVVLIEKSSGDMFTGRDACRMIQAGTGIRIPPTAFETWRVFVQSTSYGRNLMGGTGFLYEV